MSVELADVQGGVLAAYGLSHAAYLPLRVRDGAAGRALLGALAGEVGSAAPWPEGFRPRRALNVALSWRALKTLGLPPDVLGAFPGELRAGMVASAERLGDTGASAPGGWDPGLRAGEIDVLLIGWADGAAERDAYAAELAARRPDGVDAGPPLLAGSLPGAREHFGFRDGFSQPQIDDPVAGPRRRPGQGIALSDGSWRPLAPGEFVLGYEDEDGDDAPTPGGELSRNGTYMVFRKLRQHLDRFQRMLLDGTNGDSAAGRALAAKIVGRWDDGTSLELAAAAPEPGAEPPDPAALNAFTYGDDPRGLRCPLGAHVRRANPRDTLQGDGRLTRRHRIIRRGMPYGPPAADPLADDGVDRGLAFVCYQASISRQFETIQATWLMDGDAFGRGAERDVLLGGEDPGGRMLVPGSPPRYVAPRPQLVTTRGGEYLFVPGLRALRRLAGGG